MLGGAAIEIDGDLVVLSAQERRLLGILLAARGRAVATEDIVDRLWDAGPPKSAVKIVHVLVGRIRRQLDLRRVDGSRAIETLGHGYRIADATDLDEFLRVAAMAEKLATVDPPRARRAAEDAVARWTGRPFGEQADEAWLRPTVDALEERRRRTEDLWADLTLEYGGSDAPVEELRALVEAEPLRERRWSRLMIGLYRAGRQADALRAFDEAREVLRDELGLDPGPELRRLQLRVLQHDPSLDTTTTADTAAFTSFVGRDVELRGLGDALGA